MATRTLYPAAYDVCDPTRLREALHALKAHASGGQKSVFECFLIERERGELLADVAPILDLTEDRFLLLPLTGAGHVETLGVGVRPVDPEFYYVG